MSFQFFEGSFRESHPTGAVLSYSCRAASFNPSPEDIALTSRIEQYVNAQAFGSLAGQRPPKSRHSYKYLPYEDDIRSETYSDNYYPRSQAGRVREPRYSGSYAGYAPSVSESSNYSRGSAQKAIEYYPEPKAAMSDVSSRSSRRHRNAKHISDGGGSMVPFEELRYVDEFDGLHQHHGNGTVPNRPSKSRNAEQHLLSSQYPESYVSRSRAPSEDPSERGRSRTRWCDKVKPDNHRPQMLGARHHVYQIPEEADSDYYGHTQRHQQVVPMYQTVDITPYHLTPPGSGGFDSGYNSD